MIVSPGLSSTPANTDPIITVLAPADIAFTTSPVYLIPPSAISGTFNFERADEALSTNAKTVASACPFCNTMMTDGVKNFNKENEIQVLDVAELIAQAAEL